MDTIGRTRMNLLLLKRRIEIAQRGLELLRSKREALMREFFAVVDRVAENRGQLEAVIGHALSALAPALAMEGRASLRSAGYAAKRTLPIELTERNVWGVRFPEIHYAPVLPAERAAAGRAVFGEVGTRVPPEVGTDVGSKWGQMWGHGQTAARRGATPGPDGACASCRSKSESTVA
mgnify:CR=1 FL=1